MSPAVPTATTAPVEQPTTVTPARSDKVARGLGIGALVVAIAALAVAVLNRRRPTSAT